MRVALIIGLSVLAMASVAQAQTSPYRNPYGMGPAKDPYDLPKSYRTNPYDRDYSSSGDASGPGYHNADGTAVRRNYGSGGGNYGSSYGGYGSMGGAYGSSSRGYDTPSYGARPSTRSTRSGSNCGLGVVC